MRSETPDLSIDSKSGRPQYSMFPEDPLGFAIDDQYYVGDSGLLVKPITTEGAVDTVVYLSDNQVSRSIETYRSHLSSSLILDHAAAVLQLLFPSHLSLLETHEARQGSSTARDLPGLVARRFHLAHSHQGSKGVDFDVA